MYSLIALTDANYYATRCWRVSHPSEVASRQQLLPLLPPSTSLLMMASRSPFKPTGKRFGGFWRTRTLHSMCVEYRSWFIPSEVIYIIAKKHYPRTGKKAAGMFFCDLIQDLIKDLFFGHKKSIGIKHSVAFNPMPLPAIAFVLTAVGSSSCICEVHLNYSKYRSNSASPNGKAESRRTTTLLFKTIVRSTNTIWMNWISGRLGNRGLFRCTRRSFTRPHCESCLTRWATISSNMFPPQGSLQVQGREGYHCRRDPWWILRSSLWSWCSQYWRDQRLSVIS